MRIAARDVEEAEVTLKEIRTKTIGAANMDGMPKGSSVGDASAQHVIYLEYAEKQLERAKRELGRAKRDAEHVCSRLEGHMRKFCGAYYIEGFPFEVAQALSGVSRRQCYTYMSMVSEGNEA